MRFIFKGNNFRSNQIYVNSLDMQIPTFFISKSVLINKTVLQKNENKTDQAVEEQIVPTQNLLVFSQNDTLRTIGFIVEPIPSDYNPLISAGTFYTKYETVEDKNIIRGYSTELRNVLLISRILLSGKDGILFTDDLQITITMKSSNTESNGIYGFVIFRNFASIKKIFSRVSQIIDQTVSVAARDVVVFFYDNYREQNPFSSTISVQIKQN